MKNYEHYIYLSVNLKDLNNKVEELHSNYKLKQFSWFKMPWDFFGMENPISLGLWWELLNSDFDLLHFFNRFSSTRFQLYLCS